MIAIIRPVLINFLVSRRARTLLIEVLEKLYKSTDNKVDDVLVDGLRRALIPEEA